MRYSVFILIIVVFGCNRRAYTPYNFVSDHGRRQPFQVLAANSASTTSRQLKPLDILNLNDLITLKSGHLILVHNSGKFLDFNGDTAISVRQLSDSLTLKYNLKKHDLRPSIDLLLSKTFKPYKVLDGIYGHNTLYITNIGGLEVDITDPEDFCLSWTAFGIKHQTYRIELTNIFAEAIDTLYSSDTLLKINPLDYGEKLLIARVTVPDDSFYKSNEQGFRLDGTPQFLFPNQCEIGAAVEALEKAYHMDSRYYLVDRAQTYFELASDLSDDPIYDELLANYKSRRGK